MFRLTLFKLTDDTAQASRNEDRNLRNAGVYRPVYGVALQQSIRFTDGFHGQNLVIILKTII